MLTKSNEELWDNSGKIHFYINIYDYFNNGQIQQKHLNAVINLPSPIYCLWELYLKYEFLKYDSWENIEEIIDVMSENVCKTQWQYTAHLWICINIFIGVF